MNRRYAGVALLIMITLGMAAQDFSKFIVVDQFGYLPDSRKVAVIRDPQVGYDADESFTPGAWYALVDARTGELVFRGRQTAWWGGKIDESSGDRAWQFDFSVYTRTGSYYILDQERNVRSHEFLIAYDDPQYRPLQKYGVSPRPQNIRHPPVTGKVVCHQQIFGKCRIMNHLFLRAGGLHRPIINGHHHWHHKRTHGRSRHK